jgi:hypothetical protein
MLASEALAPSTTGGTIVEELGLNLRDRSM